jgi:chemotaxis protein methyltransferase CheR
VLPDEPIEDIELRLLLEAIHARYGYDLRGYALDSMHRRVRGSLAKSGLPHLGSFQHAVLSDPEFFARVLDDLTVQVSDMFRNPPMYRAFRERVVPILRSYPLLRIWHAGCASGEEAYATAILLTEEGLYDRTQIYATDLSGQAIASAVQGVFRLERLPGFAENYRQAGGTSSFTRYCTQAYDHLAMVESLRRNILFFQHNLVSDAVFGEMHMVFCRNVFIYFGPKLRERVIDKFGESLCPGGFLCLGDSEHLSEHMRRRFADFSPSERIFRSTSDRALRITS